MVAYGNAILAVSGWGWNRKGESMQTMELFDGTKWSEWARNYGDWGVLKTCLALDAEAGLFYLVGGYCPT